MKKKEKFSIRLEALKIATKEKVTIPLKGLRIAKRDFDIENIGVKIEPIYARETQYSCKPDTSKIVKLRAWLYWKNQKYPFNFIGYGIVTVSKELKISEDEAQKLLRLKLEELLPTIKDKTLKNAVERRIQRFTTVKDKTYACRRCGEEFKKTNSALKNCPKCKQWYRKNGKYNYEPLTKEEKDFLKELRRAENG